jgi:hypothetical protein
MPIFLSADILPYKKLPLHNPYFEKVTQWHRYRKNWGFPAMPTFSKPFRKIPVCLPASIGNSI